MTPVCNAVAQSTSVRDRCYDEVREWTRNELVKRVEQGLYQPSSIPYVCQENLLPLLRCCRSSSFWERSLQETALQMSALRKDFHKTHEHREKLQPSLGSRMAACRRKLLHSCRDVRSGSLPNAAPEREERTEDESHLPLSCGSPCPAYAPRRLGMG